MTRILRYLVMLLLIFMSGLGWAANIGNRKIGFDYNVSWYSRYMGNSFGLDIFHGKGGVFQQSITANFWDSGFYVGAWNSYSSKGGFNSDFGDEGINYYAGYTRKAQGITLDLSYWYYHLIDLKENDDDVHAFVLKVSFPDFSGITPYFYQEVQFPVASGGLEKGYMYNLGISYNWNLPKFLENQKKQIISFDLRIVGNDGVAGFDSGLITHGRLDISTAFQFGKIIVIPNVHVQIMSGDQNGNIEDVADGNKVWFGLRMKYSF